MHEFASHDGSDDARQAVIMVPEILPIFPLARTVLLPGEVLPLHIFEPRYREMVGDALASHRMIGMVQILPGHEGDDDVAPTPVQPVGCAGLIAQHQRLDDGRFLIWLVGVERFRISEEIGSDRAYRQVRVDYVPLDEPASAVAGLTPLRRDLRAVIPSLVDADSQTRRAVAQQIEDASDNQLLALACHVLEMGSDEKQAVLEASSLMDRYLRVYDALYRSTGSESAIDPATLN